MAKIRNFLSFSTCQNFDRCPLIFYFNKIMRISLKKEIQGIALKRGKYFSETTRCCGLENSMSAKSAKNGKNVADFYQKRGVFLPKNKKKSEKSLDEIAEDLFTEYEMVHAEICKTVTLCIRELELLPPGGIFEIPFTKHIDYHLPINLKGILDILYKGYFVELKYTQKLDFYLNEWLAHRQLLWYFYLTPPEIDRAYMCPVLVPATRQGKEESIKAYAKRTEMDILKRPSHYFPGFKPDKKGVKFGRVFYRKEFEGEFEAFEKRMKWMRKSIKRHVKANYWEPRETGCLFPGQCEYFNICTTGGYINDELYERWGYDKNTKQSKDPGKETEAEINAKPLPVPF